MQPVPTVTFVDRLQGNQVPARSAPANSVQIGISVQQVSISAPQCTENGQSCLGQACNAGPPADDVVAEVWRQWRDLDAVRACIPGGLMPTEDERRLAGRS